MVGAASHTQLWPARLGFACCRVSPVSDQNRDTRSSVGAMPARPAGARSPGRARPRPPPARPGSGGVPPSGLGPQPEAGGEAGRGGCPAGLSTLSRDCPTGSRMCSGRTFAEPEMTGWTSV